MASLSLHGAISMEIALVATFGLIVTLDQEAVFGLMNSRAAVRLIGGACIKKHTEMTADFGDACGFPSWCTFKQPQRAAPVAEELIVNLVALHSKEPECQVSLGIAGSWGPAAPNQEHSFCGEVSNWCKP